MFIRKLKDIFHFHFIGISSVKITCYKDCTKHKKNNFVHPNTNSLNNNEINVI